MTSEHKERSLFHTLYICGKIGARLHPIETIIGYAIVIPYFNSENTLICDWFVQNAIVQFLIFFPITIVPTWYTRHMFYVDIAWPCGVTAIGLQMMYFSTTVGTSATSFPGSFIYSYPFLVGLAIAVHGFRMAFGAIVLFFPYIYDTDIPRYEYAKLRFIQETNGAPYRAWSLKRTHDLCQQYYANAVILGVIGALPVATLTSRMDSGDIFQPSLLSWAGLLIWVFAWIFENKADLQKVRFMRKVKEGLTLRDKRLQDSSGKSKTYHVLGMPPFDGPEYSLWTRCRHPNYFGEWLAWVGLIISVLPTLSYLHSIQAESSFQIGCWATILLFIPRFFYDCLVYWTGAAPAEHFSHKKRGKVYEQYQQSTRVFFPFPMPFVNHAQTPGWSTLKSNA